MEIRVAQTQQDFFGLIHLRKDVFIREQNVDIDLEMDEEDRSALHLVALKNGRVIGTCRLVIHNDQAKLGRMAVAKDYRRQAVGSKLLLYAEEKARCLGVKKLLIGAQLQALAFYLRHAYKITSELYYDAGIAHKMLEKEF